MKFGLDKSERLCSKRAIETLFAEGASGFVYPFRYLWLAAGERQAPAAVLFAVPKRNHKRAHVRNLLKRRTREAYRLGKRADGMHIALIYSSKEVEPFSKIQDALRRILAQIA